MSLPDSLVSGKVKMAKIIFDIDKSLQHCPPQFLYGIGPNNEKWAGEPGIRFHKRLVKRIDSVYYDPANQPKINPVDPANIKSIKESFESIGWDYNKRPLVYYVNQYGQDSGIGGYNRGPAGEAAGWETLPFDKVSYIQPLDRMAHKVKDNNELPGKKNNYKTYGKNILQCFEEDCLEREKEDDVMEYIKRIAPHKNDKYHEKIKRYIDVRDSSSLIKLFDGDEAKLFARENNLPYDGEKRWKETGKHGFVKPNGAWNSLIAEIMSLVISIQGKDDKTIHLYGWIENPSSDPSILNRQRLEWINSYKVKVRDRLTDFYRAVGNGKENPIKLHVIFGGFYAQNRTPQPKNGGLPKESGVILTDQLKNTFYSIKTELDNFLKT